MNENTVVEFASLHGNQQSTITLDVVHSISDGVSEFTYSLMEKCSVISSYAYRICINEDDVKYACENILRIDEFIGISGFTALQSNAVTDFCEEGIEDEDDDSSIEKDDSEDAMSEQSSADSLDDDLAKENFSVEDDQINVCFDKLDAELFKKLELFNYDDDEADDDDLSQDTGIPLLSIEETIGVLKRLFLSETRSETSSLSPILTPAAILSIRAYLETQINLSFACGSSNSDGNSLMKGTYLGAKYPFGVICKLSALASGNNKVSAEGQKEAVLENDQTNAANSTPLHSTIKERQFDEENKENIGISATNSRITSSTTNVTSLMSPPSFLLHSNFNFPSNKRKISSMLLSSSEPSSEMILQSKERINQMGHDILQYYSDLKSMIITQNLPVQDIQDDIQSLRESVKNLYQFLESPTPTVLLFLNQASVIPNHPVISGTPATEAETRDDDDDDNVGDDVPRAKRSRPLESTPYPHIAGFPIENTSASGSSLGSGASGSASSANTSLSSNATSSTAVDSAISSTTVENPATTSPTIIYHSWSTDTPVSRQQE